MKRKVLIVGSDEHAAFVGDAVERIGGEVVALDPTRHVPTSLQDGVVSIGGAPLDVVSAYVKALHFAAMLPTASEVEDAQFDAWSDKFTAARERHSFVAATLKALFEAGIVVVNPVHTFDLHLQKAHQMTVLRRAGIRVPTTLATTDPAAVRAFAARHHPSPGVIYKPLAGGAEARLLVDDDLDDERLALLAFCPALFQERIEGDEVRAYVLLGPRQDPLDEAAHVAAFAVPTDGSVDARVNLARVRRTTAPSAWAVARAATRACGLVFAAVDMRLPERREPVILEVNPAPAIRYFDASADGVVASLARYLVDGGS